MQDITNQIFLLFSSRWHNDPYTLGSYSYPSIKCDNYGITPADLAVPLTTASLNSKKHIEKPLLLFSGEGVDWKYYSTAHAAYFSGEDQAKIILDYKKKLLRN